MIDVKSFDLSTLPSLPLKERLSLPSISAIYFAIDSQGVVCYIGRSGNLRQRWMSHKRFNDLNGIKIAWLTFDVFSLDDFSLQKKTEEAFIGWFQPRFNKIRQFRKTDKNLDYTTRVCKEEVIPLNYVSSVVWNKELGERLRMLRGDIPTYEIAKEIFTDQEYAEHFVQKLESGEIPSVSLEAIRSICGTIKVPLFDLLPVLIHRSIQTVKNSIPQS